jgi:hypothetical protein
MALTQIPNNRRVKVSLSLDPATAEYLDAYIAAHPTLNRSRVVEAALREFRQHQIEAELEAQYAEPESPEVQRELEGWRRIRRAAAQRAFDGN